jgi:hypothetical protein
VGSRRCQAAKAIRLGGSVRRGDPLAAMIAEGLADAVSTMAAKCHHEQSRVGLLQRTTRCQPERGGVIRSHAHIHPGRPPLGIRCLDS